MATVLMTQLPGFTSEENEATDSIKNIRNVAIIAHVDHGKTTLVDGFLRQSGVLRKALERGLRPIVVINKIDRPNIDPHVAVDKVFDLFVELGASNEQLDFPYVFASGVKGIAMKSLEDEGEDLRPLLDLMVAHT